MFPTTCLHDQYFLFQANRFKRLLQYLQKTSVKNTRTRNLYLDRRHPPSITDGVMKESAVSQLPDVNYVAGKDKTYCSICHSIIRFLKPGAVLNVTEDCVICAHLDALLQWETSG